MLEWTVLLCYLCRISDGSNKHANGLICVFLFVFCSNLNLISRFCLLISLSPPRRPVSSFSALLFRFPWLSPCLQSILYPSCTLTAETSSPSFLPLWLSAILYPVASPSHFCSCSSPEATVLFSATSWFWSWDLFEIFSCGPRLSFFLSSFPGPALVWFVLLMGGLMCSVVSDQWCEERAASWTCFRDFAPFNIQMSNFSWKNMPCGISLEAYDLTASGWFFRGEQKPCFWLKDHPMLNCTAFPQL